MFIVFTKQFKDLKCTCYKRTVACTKFGSRSLIVDSKSDVVITRLPMSMYINNLIRTANTRQNVYSSIFVSIKI